MTSFRMKLARSVAQGLVLGAIFSWPVMWVVGMLSPVTPWWESYLWTSGVIGALIGWGEFFPGQAGDRPTVRSKNAGGAAWTDSLFDRDAWLNK